MGANALAGAWYAVAGAPGVPTAWLSRTPFDDYRIPGMVLGTAVGGSQLLASALLARGAPSAKRASVAAGAVLLAWIVVQLAMIGYVSPLQPIVLAWALTTLGLAARLPGRSGISAP
jgi:hypothetical protein